jgi:diguanylate cyclase (GGDEF)-like protein
MQVTTHSRTNGFDLIATLRKTPISWAILIVATALLAVFALDRATGAAPVQHLFYLAIIFAGLRFGFRGGVSTALVSTALYHVANPHLLTFRYGEEDLVQIVLFMAVGLIAARLALDSHRMHQLAMTDDLTGLHNLRSFEIGLARTVRAMHDAQASLALMVLDVDRLKSLNDQYGHLAGADAVRTVGHLIADWLPPDAIACRYGGDEFVVAVPRCSRGQAIGFADDLRGLVNGSACVLAGLPFPAGSLSISLGIACSEPDGEPRVSHSLTGDRLAGEALFRAADLALYRAKMSGRNSTCAA